MSSSKSLLTARRSRFAGWICVEFRPLTNVLPVNTVQTSSWRVQRLVGRAASRLTMPTDHGEEGDGCFATDFDTYSDGRLFRVGHLRGLAAGVLAHRDGGIVLRLSLKCHKVCREVQSCIESRAEQFHGLRDGHQKAQLCQAEVAAASDEIIGCAADGGTPSSPSA